MKSLLLSVVLLCVTSQTNALKKDMYSNLNFVCLPPDGGAIRGLAVDCSGFVHCSGNVAFWISCPPNQSHDGKISCSGDSSNCPDASVEIAGVCAKTNNLTVPHPSNCAMYYDCSKTIADPLFDKYERQCIPPMLFDSYTASCKDPRTDEVTCHSKKPIDECSYRGECAEPICVGLLDGNHGYSTQPFDVEYVTCLNQQVQSKHTCTIPGEIFDPHTQKCTSNYAGSIEPYCRDNPTAKFADPSLCSLFYDCSVQNASQNSKLTKHQDECPYLFLFDSVARKCVYYPDVMCGLRTEPKAPCEYSIANCYQRNECLKCTESCVGNADGDNIHKIPKQPITDEYLVCFDERTVNTKKCPLGQVFDPVARLCSSEIGTDVLDLFCSENPNGVIAHPGQCSQFYDCTKRTASGNFPKYLRECYYPQLFDAQLKDCKVYDQVNCDYRTEPQTMCDYLQFKCLAGTKCALCPDKMPNCQGLKDGKWPLIGEEMTGHYIECLGSKFKAALKCPQGQLFDMFHKVCTPKPTPEGMTTYCAMPRGPNVTSGVANPKHCGQYFLCPDIVGGVAPLMECPYPNEYSISAKTCRTYKRVDCSERFEKLKACEYATQDPCKGTPGCVCDLPVCEGVIDGSTGPYNITQFYRCQDGRSFIYDCGPLSKYDPAIGRCEGSPPPDPTTTEAPAQVPTTKPQLTTQAPTTTQAPITTKATTPPPGPTTAPTPSETEMQQAKIKCRNQPATEAVPHSVNCHWFFNCSNPDFVSECSYPSLFDSMSEICVEYSLALCKGVNKPQQMCEYDQYRRLYPVCSATGACAECERHHPVCVGKQDNFRGGLTVDKTQYYECRDNRTILYQCDAGLEFDGTMCSPPVAKPDEASSIREASGFCVMNPLAKVANRDNCAKYYDCENSQMAKEKECEYPKLFERDVKACQHNVVCGSRAEHKTACSYSGILALYPNCMPNAVCVKCEQDYPSCVGKVDGYKGAVSDATKYFECSNERTKIFDCPPRNVYHPSIKRCGLDLDLSTGMASDVTEASTYCTLNRTAVIPNRDHCARFYVCGNGLIATPMECPYPRQLDTQTKTCSLTVTCGTRPEHKKPCSYLSVLDRYTNCDKRRLCAECEIDFPSCVGKPDNFTGAISSDPSSYYFCRNERTYVDECGTIGNIFLPAINKCGPDPTIPLDPLNSQTVNVECVQHPTKVYPMEGSCARYYDCKLGRNGPLGAYVAECDHPLLFDGFDGQCKVPTAARCLGRYAEIDRCEYLAIRYQYCPPVTPASDPCMTCVVENPSCRGKLDHYVGGIRINDAMFYTCLNSRTTISYCPDKQVFNSGAGQCRPMVPPTTTPAPVVTTPTPSVPIIAPRDITGFCFANRSPDKTVFAAHPDSCAKYWNCSYVPNSAPIYYDNYLQECDYPMYFNRLSGVCDPNFDSVDCGTRKKVITPCEYIAFTKALCKQTTSCAFCENAQLSCRGKQDGYKDSMPQQKNQYFECRNQRTTIGTCPDQQLFDSVLARCQLPTKPTIPVMLTVNDAEQPCSQNPQASFPHAKNCAQYFNCSVQNGPYGRFLSECTYPDLFSPPASRCMSHSQVSCGKRYEPRLRCEYFGILTKYCRILGTNCQDCDTYNPSCIAQNDGLRGTIKGTRTKYYTCMKERTMIDECQATYEFDMATRKCIPLQHLSSSAEAEALCKSNPTGMYPSTLSCAQYFNCSQTTYGRFGRFKMECPYPDVFSINSRACDDPATTDCGQRPELKNPCEYMANMKVYTGVDCVLPSCVGKLDGLHHYPGKELQRDYIACRGNRFIGSKTCRPNEYFDPVIKNCRDRLTQSAVDFFCALYPNRRASSSLNCAQYINCNPQKGQLIECGYARLFDGYNCVDPTLVTCGTRYEPVAPCEYAQNKNCPRNKPNCAPCEQRIPSCVGLRDGEVPYPNKGPSPLFVKCKNNRTISVIKCRSDLFHPQTGKCGGAFTPSYIVDICKKYPLAKFADPSWCSRYYDCASVLRNLPNPPFPLECRYPELYDIDAACTNIFETATTTVPCGRRKEPLDACQYYEHCGYNTYPVCKNCTDLIPSCHNRVDRQFYNYNDDRSSSQYFFCFRQRTVLYGKCRPDQRFDVLNGACLSKSIPWGTIIATTTSRPFVK